MGKGGGDKPQTFKKMRAFGCMHEETLPHLSLALGGLINKGLVFGASGPLCTGRPHIPPISKFCLSSSPRQPALLRIQTCAPGCGLAPRRPSRGPNANERISKQREKGMPVPDGKKVRNNKNQSGRGEQGEFQRRRCGWVDKEKSEEKAHSVRSKTGIVCSPPLEESCETFGSGSLEEAVDGSRVDSPLSLRLRVEPGADLRTRNGESSEKEQMRHTKAKGDEKGDVEEEEEEEEKKEHMKTGRWKREGDEDRGDVSSGWVSTTSKGFMIVVTTIPDT
eukprot:750443-Hanusia_phi.AAC.1